LLSSVLVLSEASSFIKPVRRAVHLDAISKRSALREVQELQTCPVLSCASLGQNCNSTVSSLIVCASTNSYCTDSGTCASLLPAGSACNLMSYNQQCITFCNASGICSEDTSTSPSVLSPGQPCTSADICSFENSTGIYNLCVNGYCYGLPEGATCEHMIFTTNEEYSSQCLNGYCDAESEKCLPYVGVGQNCNTAECSPFLTCFYNTSAQTTANCQISYSGKLGQYCSDSSICPDNSYCDSTNQVCVSGGSSGQSCAYEGETYTTTSSCPDGESCQCSYSKVNQSSCALSSSPNPAGAASVTAKAVNCALSSGCSADDNVCLARQCQSQLCASISLELNSLKAQYQTFGYPACYVSLVVDSFNQAFADIPLYSACFKNGQITSAAMVTTPLSLLGFYAVILAVLL